MEKVTSVDRLHGGLLFRHTLSVAHAPGNRELLTSTSPSAVARQVLLLPAADGLLLKPAYRPAALDALGQLLGRNVFGRAFVTGVGFDSLWPPHDQHSGSDALQEPWPGYLAGGARPKAADWRAEQGDFGTNDIAIDSNAALACVLAGALAEDRRQGCASP
jgi:endoglucanase